MAVTGSLPAHCMTATHSMPLNNIYAGGVKECEDRWTRVHLWAERNEFVMASLFGFRFYDIDKKQIPIPVKGLQKGR